MTEMTLRHISLMLFVAALSASHAWAQEKSAATLVTEERAIKMIEGDDIVTLYQDRQDNIWLALHGELLNLISARTPVFRSWFLVPREDHMIPPDAQRGMAARAGARLREVAGSHAIYVSQPQAVAAWIEEAARRIPAQVVAK